MARLRLFVSAGPDLEADREAVGRIVAQLPVTIGWVIKGTPRGRVPPDLQEFVTRCDFYVFLLGSDIVAPVGVEWATARRAKRTPLAFLRSGARTPAARAFAFEFEGEWNRYEEVQDLEKSLRKMLAQDLLGRAEELHLTLMEWENLSEYVERLARDDEILDVKERPEEESRMGSGGVIIGPGRDLPSGGVLISDQDEKID